MQFSSDSKANTPESKAKGANHTGLEPLRDALHSDRSNRYPPSVCPSRLI